MSKCNVEALRADIEDSMRAVDEALGIQHLVVDTSAPIGAVTVEAPAPKYETGPSPLINTRARREAYAGSFAVRHGFLPPPFRQC